MDNEDKQDLHDTEGSLVQPSIQELLRKLQQDLHVEKMERRKDQVEIGSLRQQLAMFTENQSFDDMTESVSSVQTLTSQIKQLKLEVANLKSKGASSERLAKERQVKINRLDEMLRSEGSEREVLNIQVDEEKQRSAVLEERLQLAEAEAEDLKGQLVRANKNCMSLSRQLQAVQAERVVASTPSQSVISPEGSLGPPSSVSTVSSVDARELDALRIQFEEREKEMKELQKLIGQQSDVIEKIKKKMEEKLTKPKSTGSISSDVDTSVNSAITVMSSSALMSGQIGSGEPPRPVRSQRGTTAQDRQPEEHTEEQHPPMGVRLGSYGSNDAPPVPASRQTSATITSSNREKPDGNERRQVPNSPFGHRYEETPKESKTTLRDCIICGKKFSAQLIQEHILECVDRTDYTSVAAEESHTLSGKPALQRSSSRTPSTEVLPGWSEPEEERVCPVCGANFPSEIPQPDFELHVFSHFEGENAPQDRPG